MANEFRHILSRHRLYEEASDAMWEYIKTKEIDSENSYKIEYDNERCNWSVVIHKND
jgi:hypothetical protein